MKPNASSGLPRPLGVEPWPLLSTFPFPPSSPAAWPPPVSQTRGHLRAFAQAAPSPQQRPAFSWSRDGTVLGPLRVLCSMKSQVAAVVTVGAGQRVWRWGSGQIAGHREAGLGVGRVPIP